MWLDGICKKCGSLVLETDCRTEPVEIVGYSDYKNRCLNPMCEEYKWHYVGDQEEADYYNHDPRISEKIIIKE